MPNSENSNEQRLVELESRVSFQDHMIDELNGVVTSQQEQIDALEKRLELLHAHLKAMRGETDGV